VCHSWYGVSFLRIAENFVYLRQFWHHVYSGRKRWWFKFIASSCVLECIGESGKAFCILLSNFMCYIMWRLNIDRTSKFTFVVSVHMLSWNWRWSSKIVRIWAKEAVFEVGECWVSKADQFAFCTPSDVLSVICLGPSSPESKSSTVTHKSGHTWLAAWHSG